MRTATIREAKDKLEELIAAARAGEEVEITDGGRPVAELTASRAPAGPPPLVTRSAHLEDRLAAMVAEGLLKPSKLPPDASAIDMPPPGESGVLHALLEERSENW